jgi:hypothetical protein
MRCPIRPKHLLPVACAAAALALPLLGATARAQAPDGGLGRRIDRLEKQNEKLEQQNQELMKALKELQQARPPAAADADSHPGGSRATLGPPAEAAATAREEARDGPEGRKNEDGYVAVGSDLAFKASWDDGFVARTANDDFRFHVGGRAQQDWGAFWPNAHFNQAFPGGWDPGADFRSLRIRTDGSCWEIVDFVLEMDFISSSNLAINGIQPNFPTPTDVYFDIKQIPFLGTFRTGHFKEPFSLERYGTSETDLTFMERSAAHDAFDPVRNLA